MARFAALILALALGSASAFLPATRMQRAAVSVSAESGRREFASAAAAALAGVGFVQGASASAGTGAKFSLFGITKGQATSMSEGAAFGTDQSAPIYSPYSQYSPVTDKSLSNKVDKTVAYKEFVLNSEKRLPNYPAYIASKKWLEVKTENTRYLYSLRNAMNGLATTPAAKAAAKKVYLDLEELTYGATVKSQDKCNKAYAALIPDFAAYKKTVGL